MNLQSGQNIPLQQSAIRLNLQYPAKSGFKGEPDTCLFLLNAQGKVSGDSDFIFYNNLASPEGAVKLVTGSQQSSIDIALDRVPANVSKIAITVVIDGEDTISGLSLLSI
ncbi:TerD family protein, partial [Enterobacter kobei]